MMPLVPQAMAKLGIAKALVAVAVAIGLVALYASPAHAVSTFTVDSTADTNTTACTAAAGDCTLRGAINAANSTANSGGADLIEFDIPGSGVQKISPQPTLPTITQAVTIDGYSQDEASENTQAVGSDANLLIELDGSGAGSANGLVISAEESTVRGLVINRFSSDGIALVAGASGNTVAGNHIGTDVQGEEDLGNTSQGVRIQDAPDNTVGGTGAGARNVISGNGSTGVSILQFGGGDASGNEVMGNYIGTDAQGEEDLGNTFDGVLIQGASENTVGGTTAGARNVISGNGGSGVLIFQNQGGDASGNEVMGNYVGTDATGASDLGNTGSGVVIQDAPDNTVGGAGAAARNVLSGNGGAPASVSRRLVVTRAGTRCRATT